MSKFVTSIKVDIDGAKRALPKGSFFHGVQAGLGFESIDLVWEHDALKTPFDYPVPFSLQQLQNGTLPAEVVKGPRATDRRPPDPTTEAKKVRKAGRAGVKQRA